MIITRRNVKWIESLKQNKKNISWNIEKYFITKLSYYNLVFLIKNLNEKNIFDNEKHII